MPARRRRAKLQVEAAWHTSACGPAVPRWRSTSAGARAARQARAAGAGRPRRRRSPGAAMQMISSCAPSVDAAAPAVGREHAFEPGRSAVAACGRAPAAATHGGGASPVRSSCAATRRPSVASTSRCEAGSGARQQRAAVRGGAPRRGAKRRTRCQRAQVRVVPVLVARRRQARRAAHCQRGRALRPPAPVAAVSSLQHALPGRLMLTAAGRLLEQPVVAAALELERQRPVAAACSDAAARQHVHVVRHDVVEQALVVRDQHDGALRASAALLTPCGDDLQRVDVEARNRSRRASPGAARAPASAGSRCASSRRRRSPR